jgi:hypothetical protein
MIRRSPVKSFENKLRLFQNPVGANLRFDETTSWKSGQIGRKSGPLFPLSLRLLFQKLKFWNSLSYFVKTPGFLA